MENNAFPLEDPQKSSLTFSAKIIELVFQPINTLVYFYSFTWPLSGLIKSTIGHVLGIAFLAFPIKLSLFMRQQLRHLQLCSFAAWYKETDK